MLLFSVCAVARVDAIFLFVLNVVSALVLVFVAIMFCAVACFNAMILCVLILISAPVLVYSGI